MKTNPKISVIIPVYNPGKHLYKCLDSIVNQTHKNLEIILVDDGSTDGSGKVCDEYKEKDNRIKVLHQENSGVSRTRNAGIDIATGDYYHFPDSDDYLELDTYEYCLELMEKNDCDAVVYEHFITYPSHEEKHQSPSEYYGLYDGKDEIIKIYFRIAFAWNKLYSKKLIKAEDETTELRFREDIFRGEDGLFSLQALSKADKVWFTDRALLHYVQSDESACRGVFRPSQLSLIKAIDVTKEFLEKNYPKFLPNIEKNELSSCVMLYSDMYLDKKDYSKECKEIEIRFKKLYKKAKGSSLSKKDTIKFGLFNISPSLYCKIHKINANR